MLRMDDRDLFALSKFSLFQIIMDDTERVNFGDKTDVELINTVFVSFTYPDQYWYIDEH